MSRPMSRVKFGAMAEEIPAKQRAMWSVARSSVAPACRIAAALLLAPAIGLAQGEAAAPPSVTIAGSELRSLKSRSTGRDYDLYVLLPGGYAQNSTKRYPVVYVLDGQWNFKLMASVSDGLVYDKFVPEMIVVGITYSGAKANYDSLRVLDLTTVAVSATPGSGGAPKFLAFLEQEVLPFVDSIYRADPSQRVLIGSSYGGLFTLYTLLTKPTLFSRYIVSSPAVTFASGAAIAQEKAYAAAHKELPARVFIAVGDAEPLAQPVRALMGMMRGRNYRGLELETRMIAGERHSGNKPETFNRGLRFLFGGTP